jgi:hypothetical protein
MHSRVQEKFTFDALTLRTPERRLLDLRVWVAALRWLRAMTGSATAASWQRTAGIRRTLRSSPRGLHLRASSPHCPVAKSHSAFAILARGAASLWAGARRCTAKYFTLGRLGVTRSLTSRPARTASA